MFASAKVSEADPVVALYRQYGDLGTVRTPMQAQTDALRARSVIRYGEVHSDSRVSVLWKLDLNPPALIRLTSACDDLHNQPEYLTDERLDIPAIRLEGTAAQRCIALDMGCGMDRARRDCDLQVSLRFMEDATYMLAVQV